MLRKLFLSIILLFSSNAVFADSSSDLQLLLLTEKCENCEFSSMDGQLRDFSGFSFIETKFLDSNINSANFNHAKFRRVSFVDGSAVNAIFEKADFKNSGEVEEYKLFSGIDLRGVNFAESILFYNDFYYVRNLLTKIFVDVNLTGANFSNSKITGRMINVLGRRANFQGVEFNGRAGETKIIDSDLSHSLFQNANMRKITAISVDFSSANFESADLYDANLSGANFSNAVLESVDLSFANLSDADFTGASLKNAKLDGANLCEAIGPDGIMLFIGCE